MNTFPRLLYFVILWQASSVELDPIALCGKPEFREAYYDGHVVAAAPGTQLELICYDQYMPGNPSTMCQDGRWTDPSPPCKLVECQYEDLVTPHVLINEKCRRHGCVVDLLCERGYWYEGHMRKTCQRNGTWSGPVVRCDAVQCKELPILQNGKIHQTDRSYLAIATVRCDSGYVYSKSMTRQCQFNNTWSGEDGICKERICPAIPNLEYGTLSANTGRFKDIITLQCKAGYILDGLGSIKCTAYGNWSAIFGKCREADNKYLVPILGTIIPLVVVAVPIAIYMWWRKKGNSRKENNSPEIPSETLPLLGHSVKSVGNHFTFILAEDCKNAYSDEFGYRSFIYTVQDAIVASAKKLNIVITTTILYLCERKSRGFLTIYSESPVDEHDLVTAIGKADIAVKKGDDRYTYTIPSSSIKVVDKIQCARSAEILLEKHVKDMSVDDRIDFDTQYVKLRLHTQPTVGIMQGGDIERPDSYQNNLTHQVGAEIEDEDLIKEDSKKYILLRGRAGIGKSTLMQRFLWKWANGEWATHLRVMFLLNLRYLMTIKKPMDLLYMLNVHTAYNTGRSNFTIDLTWLRENEMRIAFVLDGVDEVRDFMNHWMGPELKDTAEPIQWCFALMRRRLLLNSTIIVSSRPFADLGCIPQTLKEKSLSKHLQLVELMGLTRERVNEFVNKNVQEGSKDFVWQTLERNPILMSISSITFYCAALCKILGEWTDAPLQLKTYTQITAYIIDRFIQRSLQKVESPFKVDEILKVLSQLAFNGLVQEIGKGPLRLVFDAKDIEQLCIEKNVTNIMIKTGLLMQTEILDPKDKEQCTVLSQFVHLMIQEFLAMARLLAQSPKEFKPLLKELCKTQQFSMARLFLYGIAFNTDSDIIKKLTMSIVCEKNLHSNREKLKNLAKNMPDKLQAVQVAHESQSADVAYAVGQHNFKDGCHIENTKLTVIDVLALSFVLKHNPSIHTIRLERAELDKTSVTEISEFVKSENNIDELVLIDDTLDDESVEELMLGVKGSTHLETLEISSDALTDKGLSSVASALLTSKSVQKLNLTSSAVTDTGVEALAHCLKRSTTLHSLRIMFRGMTDRGVRLLAASLGTNKTLQEFWLIEPVMTDGVTDLGQALKINTTVQHLRVDCKDMTDDGVAKIADSLAENTSLIEIRLHSKCITDEGVKYLMSRLKDHENLAEIVLSGFYMTEDAVTALLDTMMTTPLLTIGMWEPEVSNEILQQIRANDKIKFM